MNEYFRIIRGLELDDTVRILHGAGAPGSTSDTDTAQVGSFYLDTTNGTAYSKKTAGSGAVHWGSVNQSLYTERNVAGTPPATGADNSIALGSGAATAAGADGSIAIGDQSLARHPGAQMFAGGRFASSGDAQSGKYLIRAVTSNSTPTELFLDGAGATERLVLTDDSTWTFTITVTAHRTDTGTDHAGYKIEGVIYRRNGVATTSFQGSPIYTIVAESDPSWDINITSDVTFGGLRVFVTGQSGKIIRWVALVETVEVTN